MFRLKPQIRLLLVLMCVLTLGVRVSGAHMHLCLDGGEPPVALHIQPDMDTHHADASHVDVDVSLAGKPLLKKAGVDTDLSAAAASAYLMFLLPPQTAMAFAPALESPAFHSAHHLRPPQRGPPV